MHSIVMVHGVRFALLVETDRGDRYLIPPFVRNEFTQELVGINEEAAKALGFDGILWSDIPVVDVTPAHLCEVDIIMENLSREHDAPIGRPEWQARIV